MAFHLSTIVINSIYTVYTIDTYLSLDLLFCTSSFSLDVLNKFKKHDIYPTSQDTCD